jgi:HSP20 family protein
MFNVPMIRKNKIHDLARLDSLFDEFFNMPFRFNLSVFDTLPAIDTYEKADKITVRAEIPGVRPEELEVSVDNNLLTIKGEKKHENEVNEKDYYRRETSYGKFERTIRLPEAVKVEGAKATYKNGVLKVELAKSEEAKRKKIKIDVN